jgi:hypothetical protein
MVNMIRIFMVLFCLIAVIFAANYTYNWYTHRFNYTPITPQQNTNTDNPTIENFQERLNKHYEKYGADAIATKPSVMPTMNPTIVSTITPAPTLKPTIKPTITPTVKPIPQERVTAIKAGDSSKILATSDGIDTIDMAIEPSTFYLGRQYYYVGDYAVFKMQFINICDKIINTPKVIINVYKGNIPVYTINSKLDVNLTPTEKSEMQYFDLTIPNFKGFYRIVFEFYDSTDNRRLMAFYKEINIL